MGSGPPWKITSYMGFYSSSHSSIAIILMGKRELVALLNLSSWCLVMVEPLFLAVPLGCLQFVIVVFADHTHLLFSIENKQLDPPPTPWKKVAPPLPLENVGPPLEP